MDRHTDEQILQTIAKGIDHLQRATFGASFLDIPRIDMQEGDANIANIDIDAHLKSLLESEQRLVDLMSENLLRVNSSSDETPPKEKFKQQVYHYSLHRSHDRIRATVQFIRAVQLMSSILDFNHQRLENLSGTLKGVVDDLKAQLAPDSKHRKDRDMNALNRAIVERVRKHSETLADELHRPEPVVAAEDVDAATRFA